MESEHNGSDAMSAQVNCLGGSLGLFRLSSELSKYAMTSTRVPLGSAPARLK